VIAFAGLASLACDKEHSCRPGTVFVHVTTGPFITANRVDVDVYINGVGPEHTELGFAAGTRGGGVEVQFPKGYPEGLMVRIDLTLKANGITIASHREDFTPRGECEAIDVVFVPSDGLTGGGGAGGWVVPVAIVAVLSARGLVIFRRVPTILDRMLAER